MLKDDPQDMRLIQLLQQDGRQSSNVLAKQLGLSSATVRRRIKKLVQSGLLRITARVDPDQAGFPFSVVIALDVVHDRVDKVLKYLANKPEVVWACATTGRFDVLLIAHFPSSDHLSAFLREELAKIEGLKDSETFLCLRIEKGRYQPVY